MIKYEKEFEKYKADEIGCCGGDYCNGSVGHNEKLKEYINSLLLRQIDEDNKRFLGILKKEEWKGDCTYPVLYEQIAHNRCLEIVRAELTKVNKNENKN